MTRAIGQVSSPVLLVGHSYGGTVITAAGIDDRVAGLVYIAALAPGAPGFGGDSILPQMLWSGWPLSSTVPPHGGTTV